MTMVIRLRNREGVLIASDSRATCAGGIALDLQKVQPIGRNGAAGFAGTAYLELRGQRSDFDPFQAVLSAVAPNEAISEASTDRMAEALMNSLDSYLQRHSGRDWPVVGPDPEMCRVALCWHDGNAHMLDLTLEYRSGAVSASRDVAVREKRVPESALSFAWPYAVGSGNVLIDEIRAGTDPRCDHLREDPLYRRFVLDCTRWEDVSLDEAVTFCRRAISDAAAVSEYLADGEYRGSIGGPIRLALLTADGLRELEGATV